MKTYVATELKRFLECIDSQLDRRQEMIVIGGAAAALAYGARRATVDIDTISDVTDLAGAFQTARETTGLNIPVQIVGVWDGPYSFEDRLESLGLDLKNLRIQVPEKHDLALMKIVRGQEHDRSVIAEIAATVGIDEDVLVARFKTEMDHVVAVREDVLRLNFLALIELLFGETEADRVEAELKR